jgi:hypothetical protein
MGAEVTLFEGNDRPGKKILATGNGRCNLGNRNLDVSMYYTSETERLSHWLEAFGTTEAVAFFEGLGLKVKEKNGFLYPLSEQASSVLDVLRFEIERQGEKIRLMTETKIDRIERDKKHRQICLWSGDKKFSFDRVILACGGKAAAKTGSDGSGYKLAGMLGHSLVPVVPALVQLKCREDFFKAVSGVRAEAAVTLKTPEGITLSERGELQFTDSGISGIVVFQLSRAVNYILREVQKQGKKEVTVTLDFLPEEDREGFGERLFKERARLRETSTAEVYFTGLLNKKLMSLFMREAGIRPTEKAADVPEEKLKKVFALCRDFPVHVTGSNSFENAQVCAGGVPLSEVTDSLESKIAPGVFFAGELLDVDGKCGGYNLHWAWCSGTLAAEGAAEGGAGLR